MTDESIFAMALCKFDPAERAAYLDEACAGDTAKRSRVERLLSAYSQANDFLEGPAYGAFAEPGPTRRIGAPADTEEDEDPLTFLQPAMRPDSLGRIGHYEVLEVVGRGGFGIVFRAFDDILQRVVAIKVLAPRMAATSPARKRFVREARGYAAVRHENVVQVHAIEAEPLPYIVMEFVPGQTLETMLAGSGPLDANDVVQIGLQLARGLAAAHDQGIVHRDIKPANILIENSPERRVKLTDFGLARAADDASLTQSGMIAGTPMYMAPEQAAGKPIDHRADLFSLGSVLYAMCTGRPPFRATTSLAVLNRVVEANPRPIRDIIPETPQALCDIIEKLHAREPEDRYQTAHELAQSLQVCRVSTASSQTKTPAPRSRSRSRRDRMAILLVVLGCVIAGGAFAIHKLKTKTPIEQVQQPQQPEPKDQQPPQPKPKLPGTRSIADVLGSPDFEWSEPVNLGLGVNTSGRESSPTLTDDELRIVFMRDGRLWTSQRERMSDPFGKAVPLPVTFTGTLREGHSITGDGLVLVFCTEGDTPGKSIVWLTTRASLSEPFNEPVTVKFDTGGWAVAPVLSSDGLTLLVTNMRLGGLGKGDIVMLTRKSRAELFGSETQFPPPVNSPQFDVAFWVSNDRNVLVRTTMDKQPYVCEFLTRTEQKPFGEPQTIGYRGKGELGRPWISPDGMRLYFHSRELPNGNGQLDIWMLNRIPKQ